MTSKATKTGFTLIEVLVSIAIIAILAQILIPALATAKKKAREIKCMSNVKQANSAINLYSEDFLYFPYGNSAGMDFPRSIKTYLWPYSNEDSPLLECADALHSTDPKIVWVSYAVHPVIMPDFTIVPAPAITPRFWRAGQIKRLSDTVMIAESPQLINTSCYPTLKSIPGILTNGSISDQSKKIEGDFSAHDEDGVNSNAGWMRYRHIYRRANAAFADGHASNIKINTLVEGNVKTNY